MRVGLRAILFLGLCLLAAGAGSLLGSQPPDYVFGAYCDTWTCDNPADGTYYRGHDLNGNPVATCIILRGVTAPFKTCLYGSGGPCPISTTSRRACLGSDPNNPDNSCLVDFYDCGS